MSALREELLQLVEDLPENEVPVVLADLRARRALAGEWPPAWFGAAQSGDPELSQRVDEVLAEGFGR